jgi:hypothetical protein
MEKGIALLCGAEIPGGLIFKPIAQLAGSGRPVYVVDGDNSFRSYLIARYAREMNLDPRLALANVQVSRAFTCYQLAERVKRLSEQADTPNCTGIVCLGLLGTFYDEDVALSEAQRLLQEVIAYLKVLADRCLVLVTVRPPPSKARSRMRLAQALMQQADAIRLWQSTQGDESPAQIPLILNSGRRYGTHQ